MKLQLLVIAVVLGLLVFVETYKPHTIVFDPSRTPEKLLDHYEVYRVEVEHVGDAKLHERTFAVKAGCYFMRTIDKRGTPSKPSDIGCTPGTELIKWERKRIDNRGE